MVDEEPTFHFPNQLITIRTAREDERAKVEAEPPISQKQYIRLALRACGSIMHISLFNFKNI
jgi:hypothetical protein